MEWTVLLLTIISLMWMQVAGAEALTNNSDIIGIAVAGCASFVLLSFVIGMLIASCNWGRWFRKWMRQQGKVRMPNSYFKQKRGESKQRLVTASPNIPVHQVNGHLPRPVVDRETLVQGWRQANPSVTNRIYEEKDATVELGDEAEDEYKIETEVVDNETLDVGPFKHDHSKEIPIKGDVYAEPYIYSAVDSTKKSAISLGSSVKPSSDSRQSAAVSQKSGKSGGNSVKPGDDPRAPAVVNGSVETGYFPAGVETGYSPAGVETETKFGEGLFYM